MFTRYLIEEMIVDGTLEKDVMFVDLMFSMVHYHYCVHFFLYSLKQSIVIEYLSVFFSPSA